MANEFKVKNGLIVSGSADFEQDLRVRGTLTVDEFHTSITTSSVIFESGSTAFGNSLDDTHTLTGSVNITGSITLNGQAIGTGKLDETTFQTYTSSYNVATSDFNGLTSSYNSFTTSYISNSSSFNSRVGSLESFSSSLDASFVNEVEFALFSSSIKNFTSSLNNYTNSLENKLNVIDSTTSSLNTFTSSANGRLNSIESATASLYSFSSSVNNRLSTVETSTGSLNTFSSSTNNRLNAIETSTSSLNSYSSSNDIRLGVIETSTSSLNSFTSSINTTIKNKLNADGVISGSSQILNGSNVVSSSTQVTNYGFAITGSNLFKGDQTHSGSIIPAVDNAYDLGSPTYQWRDVYISSGSLYVDGTKVLSSTAQELQITTDNGQSIKILEGGTDSIILQTADGDVELKSNGDGDILLDPTNGKITLKGPVEILNGNKIQSSVGGTPVVFANDIVVSGSIDITGTIEGINLTDFSSSVNTRVSNLETSAGSLNTFTSSTNTRLGNLETESGSIRTTVNSYTSSTNNRLTSIETTTGSILSANTTQDGRLTSIESKTGSYATTGSNVFIGNQTITGSLYVSQDLIIAGSSSIQHISSSVVNIADNIITVNAQNPSIRFGGLAVIDSGSSPQVSGSILFDSTNDQWIFIHQNQTTLTSSVVIMGPQTYDNIGNETYPTTNRILKSVNAEHVGDSNISDNGTTVTILSNTIINGTISATGTTLVSGSAQISFNGITDKPALVSGSSQVSYTGLSNVPSGIVSGSSQVSYPSLSNIPSGIVSGSSQITYSGISGTPSGIVSGSAQIDLTATTNYSSGIKTRLNAENVLSSSAQVVSALPAGTVSGSSQVLAGTTIHSGSFFNGISVVSGSGQISFGGITGVPSGLVSGSSQITFGSISSIPSGLVSGSSQITYSSISSIPSGIVSGSAQLTSTFVQKAGDTMTGALTAPGITSSAGLTVSGTAYYTFNKPSTTNYQTVALFGSTANGIFITSDSGIISRGAFFNGGWQATSSTGAYLNFNTSGGGMDLNVFSGATIGGAATFTSLFTVARDNFSFNSNSILHAGNYNSYSPTLTGTGASGNWGINITGNAGTVTNGVYTTGDQTIAGTKTFSNRVVFNSAIANRPQFPGGILGLDTSDGDFDIWGISRDYYPSHPTSANAWGLRWNGTNNDFEFVGGGTNRVILDMDSGNITSTGTISASNFSGTSSGTNTGDQTNITGNAGTVTNGVYTTGNQTIGGVKTFSDQLVLNKSGTQLKISRADTAAADWFFHSWASGLNIYPNAAGTVYFGRDGSATNVDVYNGTLYQQGNAVIHAGNIGSQTVASAGNSTTVGGISPIQFFNNMGQNHSTQTDFNSISNFGFRFVQGSTNGPGTGSSQFYGFSIGLGNDYAFSDYALQLAMPRYNSSDKYFSFRTREAGTWGSWSKISAGYADSAGSVSGANVSGNISGNASNITSYTINQSVGTSNTVQFSSLGIGVSPALTLHARGSGEMVRFENTSTASDGYTQLNFKAGSRNGYIWLGNQNTSSWAGAGGLNIYTENGNMDFWTNATQRVRIQSDGHMVPFINGTYNLGSSSLRWNTVFTSDLSLSNGIGDYTIVEGENDLFLYNNKQNKVYKFMLQEVNAEDATPKRPE
jgi:hypothetical protein